MSRRCGVYSLAWSDSVHPAILELAGQDPPTALSSSHHHSCFPCSTHSYLSRQAIDQTLVSVLIHFFPEGLSLRRIPVLPQTQETSFHELLISDPVRGKNAARPSTTSSKLAAWIHHLHRWTTGVPFATTLAQSDAQLRRSLQNDRTKWKPVRCNTARASLSLTLSLSLTHTLSLRLDGPCERNQVPSADTSDNSHLNERLSPPAISGKTPALASAVDWLRREKRTPCRRGRHRRTTLQSPS